MKWMDYFRLRRSIFAKFTVSFIVVGLIPLLALSYFSLNTFSNHMERYTVNQFDQMLLFAGRNVDNLYIKYNNISKLMYSYGVDGKYGQLGEAIAAQRGSDDNRLYFVIEDFLKTVLYTDRHLQSVYYIYSNGSVQPMNKEQKVFNFQASFPEKHWMEPLQSDPRSLAFIPTHEDNYYSGSNDLVMTFGRALIDINAPNLDGRAVGTLFLDVGVSALDDIFSQMVLGSKDHIYLIDNEGTIIYSNRKDLISSTYVWSSSDEYVPLSQSLENSGWRLVGELYKVEMLEKVSQILSTIFVVIGLCIISLVTVAIFFSNRFSNPIRLITRQMAKVESGNFDIQVSIRNNDELGLLGRGFNKMVDRLKNYIDEVYVAQIKQKQAELHALKSQIRPHYLYNTLEVIRMSAVSNDDHEVGDMILSLSHQLKYVLDYGQETVPLIEEKTNIEQYFRLMEYRYGEHRLAMEFRFDAGLLKCSIPKLSIQPMVENAIYHGIMPKAGKGTVRVTVQSIGEDYLSVIVDDDGVGMSEETLEELRGKLRGPHIGESSSGGIGLKNVHDRVAALYGPEFGLEMESKQFIGTTVRMVIPLTKEVGMNDEGDIS
jgi:two-component system, sensor histidine kinase YesM